MTILKLGKYRLNFDFIRKLLLNKKPEERRKFISEIAIATCVPVIIVCYYVLEIYGPSEEITSLTERLMKFYNVDKVEE